MKIPNVNDIAVEKNICSVNEDSKCNMYITHGFSIDHIFHTLWKMYGQTDSRCDVTIIDDIWENWQKNGLSFKINRPRWAKFKFTKATDEVCNSVCRDCDRIHTDYNDAHNLVRVLIIAYAKEINDKSILNRKMLDKFAKLSDEFNV